MNQEAKLQTNLNPILTLLLSSSLAFLLVPSSASAQSCPSSHPYECGGGCYTNANQAASGGCTSGGSNSNGSSNNNNNSASSNCPSSHPYECSGSCYTDANQASSSGCTSGGNNSNGNSNNNNGASNNNNNGVSNNNGNNNSGGGCKFPGRVQSGCRTADTQSWCNTTCVRWIGNGNDGCINQNGEFLSRACVCSDAENDVESIIDIEINLGIDIDDNFIAQADYVGDPPPLNPGISLRDLKIYLAALFGTQVGHELADVLNTNGDNWVDRNEASAAKGQDPRQTLNTAMACGLAMDDVLAYVGLYLGDGSISKYQGDLDDYVEENMLRFTRTWQPGTDATACQYRGGC